MREREKTRGRKERSGEGGKIVIQKIERQTICGGAIDNKLVEREKGKS